MTLPAGASLIGPIADVGIFIAALAAGLEPNLAHLVSFGVAAFLNHFLVVRNVLASAGRGGERRVHGHLLVVAVAAVLLRGGVLSLCIGWGMPAQVAILFAVGVTTLITRLGMDLCLSTGSWTLGSGLGWRALALALIACGVALRLIYGGQVELLPEETYYWNYSRHLDIGYLDHPPMVAWLIRLGTSVFGTNELGVRSGAIAAGAVASVFVYRLTRNLFDEASALVAVVLLQLLPFFFFSGLLMTPDAPLTAAWAALLYYLERALLAGRACAWWRAGVCLGLGLLSKYTIALLVPATMLFMVWDGQARLWLRNWRPYAAALLALAIFAPVIFWNATHEWASFAFQTSRRLAEAPRFSLHRLFLSALILLTPAGMLGLCATLWGNAARAAQDAVGGGRRRRHFLQVAILTPLAVFCLFSLRHDVKFDWTGALWIAAVPALAFSIASLRVAAPGAVLAWTRRAWMPTFLVLLAIYGIALHYLAFGLPGVGYGKQMELLPVGWRNLGEQMAAVEAGIRERTGAEPLVVGLDRYETASQLAFYAPDRSRSVAQTSSDSLFGGVGLMYSRWFAPTQASGRTILIVGWNAKDLTTAKVESHLDRLDPVQEGVLSRDGKLIRRFYYRIGYGYHEVGTAD